MMAGGGLLLLFVHGHRTEDGEIFVRRSVVPGRAKKGGNEDLFFVVFSRPLPTGRVSGTGLAALVARGFRF